MTAPLATWGGIPGTDAQLPQLNMENLISEANILPGLPTLHISTPKGTPAAIAFETAPDSGDVLERLRIDASGNIMLGGGIALSSMFSVTPSVQMNQAIPTFALQRFSADVNAPAMFFTKSRSGTVGTHAIVLVDDSIFQFTGGGSDGTNFLPSVRIQGFVDSTPTSTSVPGRLTFSTATSGAGVTTERLRIDSSGNASVGTSGTQVLATFGSPAFQVYAFDGRAGIELGRFSADASGPRFVSSKSRNSGLAQTALSVSDVVGEWDFYGSDGSSFRQVAQIQGFANDNFSSGSSPGSLTFSTTTSGATSVTERMRIDMLGRISVGAGGPIASANAKFEFAGNPASLSAIMALYGFGANANSPILAFTKSRGATPYTTTVMQSGDGIGEIDFQGADGIGFRSGASLQATVDATPSSNSMPGRLSFSTTTSSSVTPTERLRIDAAGLMTTGGAANQSVAGSSTNLQINSTSTSNWGFGQILWANVAGPAGWHQAKSRNATIGSHTIVQNADTLFEFDSYGSDGTTFRQGTSIQGLVDGSPSSNSMPGRLTFLTTSSGSGAAPIERMRIDSSGNVCVGNAGTQGLGSFGTPALQVYAFDSRAQIQCARFSVDASGVRLVTSKARNSGVAQGVLSSGDVVAEWDITGSDGNVFQNVASIVITADAAFSSGSSPGRMTFNTTTSGGTAVTERMRIDSAGLVGINITPTSLLHVNGPVALKTPTTVTGTSATVGATDSTIIVSGTGTYTLTLPAASGATGRILFITAAQSFAVNSASSNVVPFGGGAAGTAILAAGTLSPDKGSKWAMLQSNGTNWLIIFAN